MSGKGDATALPASMRSGNHGEHEKKENKIATSRHQTGEKKRWLTDIVRALDRKRKDHVELLLLSQARHCERAAQGDPRDG